jgi:hypothetical protein
MMGLPRHENHRRDASINWERQFLDQLLVGHDFIFSGWQYPIDTSQFEWMAEDNKFAVRASNHWS